MGQLRNGVLTEIYLIPLFTEAKKLKEESESGYDESGSTSLYYADEMSGSGSSDWKDDDDYGKNYCL